MIEQMPGGALELQGRMERATGMSFLSVSNPQGHSNRQQLFQGIWAWALGAFRKSRRTPNQVPTLPQHNAQPTSTVQGTQTPIIQLEPLHVASCVHKGRYRRNLYQSRIDEVDTDRKLFVLLREQFTKHRGKLRSALSLRAVQGIFFIKVYSGNIHAKKTITNNSVSSILGWKR